jgi:hypothetical protein
MARFYVAPGATGNGSSWANAGDLVATVNAIIASTAPSNGDEIWARQGPYNLTSPLVINSNKAPLSIYGGFAGGETLLCQRNANINSQNYPNFFLRPSSLDGGGTNRVIEMQNASTCLIDGFVIRNGRAMTAATGLDGGGARVDGRNLIFENLVIMDNDAGNNGGGMLTAGVFNLMIKNSIFFNNQATNGGGIWIGSGDNLLLVNVLFNNNQTNGGNGNAIFVNPDPYNVKIINNTISGNLPASTPSVYCVSSLHVEIYNSILYPDTLAATGTPPFLNINVDYCLLSNPIPFILPPFNNPHGFTPNPPLVPPVNPNFVNQVPLSAGGDYHLQPTSPCTDAGSTNLIFPLSATDLEGEPRFIDKGMSPPPPPFTVRIVDMGAFEVQ